MLFVLGVMNLWWIALVAAAVLVERLVFTDAITRGLGGSLVPWSTALMLGADS